MIERNRTDKERKWEEALREELEAKIYYVRG